MKYLLALILGIFIFSNSEVSAQKTDNNSAIKRLHLEFSDSLNILNNRIKSLKIESLNQSKVLIQKLDDASNTVEYLNSVSNSFETIFAILGIFIAVLTLIIPFATYQYAVKPSQDALKELEKNFDDRLKNYLESTRNNQIEMALNNIKSGSTDLKNQGISYLTYTQNEGLTDNQLFQVYSILKQKPSVFAIKSQLAYILSFRKNDYATELFNSIEVKDDPVVKQMAIIYFAKTGYASNYNGIEHLFNSKNDQDLNFINLLLNLNQYSTLDVNKVINDQKIIDLLTNETLHKLKNNLLSVLRSLNSNLNYSDSYLYKKIEKNNA